LLTRHRRQALEVCSFVGIILAAYATLHEPFFAAIIGSAGGAVVCLTSEAIVDLTSSNLLKVPRGVHPSHRASRFRISHLESGIVRLASAVVLTPPLPGFIQSPRGAVEKIEVEAQFQDSRFLFLPIVLFGYALSAAVYVVCNHLDDTVLGVLLAAFAGVTIIVIGRLFIVFRPTRFAGFIIQARILDTARNWQLYPRRSASEAAFFVCTPLGILLVDPGSVSRVWVNRLTMGFPCQGTPDPGLRARVPSAGLHALRGAGRAARLLVGGAGAQP
jgi:hypothetical protein